EIERLAHVPNEPGMPPWTPVVFLRDLARLLHDQRVVDLGEWRIFPECDEPELAHALLVLLVDSAPVGRPGGVEFGKELPERAASRTAQDLLHRPRVCLLPLPIAYVVRDLHRERAVEDAFAGAVRERVALLLAPAVRARDPQLDVERAARRPFVDLDEVDPLPADPVAP